MRLTTLALCALISMSAGVQAEETNGDSPAGEPTPPEGAPPENQTAPENQTESSEQETAVVPQAGLCAWSSDDPLALARPGGGDVRVGVVTLREDGGLGSTGYDIVLGPTSCPILELPH